MPRSSLRFAVCALFTAAFALSLGAPAAASESPVTAARHRAVVTPAALRVRSEYVLRDGQAASFDLAFPLPAGTTLDPSAEVAPVERAGRIVGFRARAPGTDLERVIVMLDAPLDRRGDVLRVAVPLAAGDAVQIVEVSGDDGLRFEPDARTRIDRHVGFFAPSELLPSARAACDRALGYSRHRANGAPLYVQATSQLVADEGILGTLSRRGERARAGTLGAIGVFVVLVAGLALLQRKLARAVALERAERIPAPGSRTAQ